MRNFSTELKLNYSVPADMATFQQLQLAKVAPMMHPRPEKPITSNTLPNTLCEVTKQLESELIEDFQVQPYLFDVDDMATVIYSRTLNTHYLWPKDNPLTVEILAKKFKTNGHTLAISMSKSYCRLFSLDIDCLCRKNSMVDHVNMTLIQEILQVLRNEFRNILNIDNIDCTIWSNKCGFHIYTNVNVSLPTHFFIMNVIKTQFQQSSALIEIPTYMPLPYSAKEKGRPYLPELITNEYNRLPLTTTINKFVEVFAFSNLFIEDLTAAEVNFYSGKMYLSFSRPIVRETVPRLTMVQSVRIFESFSFMNEQLSAYITQQVNDYNSHITKIGDINLEEFDQQVRIQLRTFMTEINNKFIPTVPGGGRNDEQNYLCNRFIEISALENGALYLQHFVAALYKFMHFETFDKFKQFLRVIYSKTISTSPVVRTFVDKIDVNSLDCYTDSYSEIIDQLHYLIKHGVNPCDTFDNRINTVLCSVTKEHNYHAIADAINKASKKDHDAMLEVLFLNFVSILYDLKFVYYNSTSETYYILSGEYGTHYLTRTNITNKDLPQSMKNWMGVLAISNNSSSAITKHIGSFRHNNLIFSNANFMFATDKGVFNSITGLYSANTTLLKFPLNRESAIWDCTLGRDEMFIDQNAHIIEQFEVAFKYFKILENRSDELYIHAVFAPAIIQMRYELMIDEYVIECLINKYAEYNDYSAAMFIIEYFPINPKFIYLLMYIIKQHDGIGTLISYSKLCHQVFNYEVTCKDLWIKKFENFYNSITYDATAKTQLEKLKSLESNSTTIYTNEYTLLLMTILAACQIKCPTFKPFTSAFEAEIGKIQQIHPNYVDFDYNFNISCMKLNFKRAIDIVYGTKLSQFELNLVNESMSICMSANFINELILNYIDSVALTFVPKNILKKIIVYHGPSNVGKSYLCKKLQDLIFPYVVRVPDMSLSQRSEFTTNNFITIFNEVNILEANLLKMITGNDAVSTMKFYSQKLNLQEHQSLMYGATNTHISFSSSPSRSFKSTERTTIDRIYCVPLSGAIKNISANQANLLMMLLDGVYFSDTIIKAPEPNSNALGWLSYAAYVDRRDAKFTPYININSDYNRQYKNTVYYNNDSLYKFICNCGIVDEEGFYISSVRFKSIIRQNIDKNSIFKNESDFKLRFKESFGIDIDNVKYIKNFQELGLIQHIRQNMQTLESKDSCINAEDILERLNIYDNSSDSRSNAHAYFKMQNSQYYDYNDSVYKGITFKFDLMHYDGNEYSNTPNNSTSLNISSDSLVFQQV